MTSELLSSLTPYFCPEADDHGAEEVYCKPLETCSLQQGEGRLPKLAKEPGQKQGCALHFRKADDVVVRVRHSLCI
jgi:hypothetical protein